MLYYNILYYTVLYYTILYYTMLCYTILYYTVLYYTILYYTILYYTILYYTILYYTILHTKLRLQRRRKEQAPIFSRDAAKQRQITWKKSAHPLCVPIRRIYRGGRRHHADMSVVVLKTLSCRPRVLPGHKDHLKYQYHRYRRRGRHRFCRCVYARSYPIAREPWVGEERQTDGCRTCSDLSVLQGSARWPYSVQVDVSSNIGVFFILGRKMSDFRSERVNNKFLVNP